MAGPRRTRPRRKPRNYLFKQTPGDIRAILNRIKDMTWIDSKETLKEFARDQDPDIRKAARAKLTNIGADALRPHVNLTIETLTKACDVSVVTGDQLIIWKVELGPYGCWGPMFADHPQRIKNHLLINQRKAQMLMKLAASPWIKSIPVSILPESYSTQDELAKLDPTAGGIALDRHLIHKDMTREDAKELRLALSPPAASKPRPAAKPAPQPKPEPEFDSLDFLNVVKVLRKELQRAPNDEEKNRLRRNILRELYPNGVPPETVSPSPPAEPPQWDSDAAYFKISLFLIRELAKVPKEQEEAFVHNLWFNLCPDLLPEELPIGTPEEEPLPEPPEWDDMPLPSEPPEEWDDMPKVFKIGGLVVRDMRASISTATGFLRPSTLLVEARQRFTDATS